MASRKTKLAIAQVCYTMPPGTLIVHRGTRHLYMIGVKFGHSDFWAMRYEPLTRVRIGATLLVNNFQVSPSQIRGEESAVEKKVA